MIYYTTDLRKLEIIPSNFIGDGTQGKVYRLKDNICIKIYGKDVIKYNPEIFTLFKELSLPGFCRLYDLLYNNINLEKLTAYTMQYYSKEVENILLMPTEYTIHSFNLLYNSIKTLSENKILIRDALPKNTILTKDKIILIDSDDYIKSVQNKERVLQRNIERLLYLFKKLYEENLNKIINNIEDDELLEYLEALFCYNNEPVKSLQRRMAGAKVPLDILPRKYRC